MEPLLLGKEWSRLRWCGSDKDDFGTLHVCRARGRSMIHWRDYISRLAGKCLGVPYEELESIAGEREFCNTLLSLLPT